MFCFKSKMILKAALTKKKTFQILQSKYIFDIRIVYESDLPALLLILLIELCLSDLFCTNKAAHGSDPSLHMLSKLLSMAENCNYKYRW